MALLLLFRPTTDSNPEQDIVLDLVSRTKTIYGPTVASEQRVTLNRVDRTKTIFSLAVGVEQRISLNRVDRTKTIYQPTVEINDPAQDIVLNRVDRTKAIFNVAVASEQRVVLNLVSRTKQIFLVTVLRGGQVEYFGTINDVMLQRLRSLYGVGDLSELFQRWMTANGYEWGDLGTVYGQTSSESIMDAGFRFWARDYT